MDHLWFGKFLKMAVQAHRELSSQRCKCQCGYTGSPSGDSETERNTIGYDEQKAHFLYVTWSSRKGVNRKGEWTQFQGPTNSKMQRTLFWTIYTNSACLLSIQARSLQMRERERERWSRRFIMQLSENAFLLLHILVALIKVPAAHIYTTVTLWFPPSPASCTYILSQDPTSLPAVDTGHSGRTREQTHKNMQKETEFPTSRQCPSTRVHNVL